MNGAMSNDGLRKEIGDYLRFKISERRVRSETILSVAEREYTRLLVKYSGDEGDEIKAYLLLPKGKGSSPAVLAHHQHNGERHLGKSEISGLAGSPLQAFGPALARQGIAVLAPDSICFEDRRRNKQGTEPDEDHDYVQHYNEMSFRLVRGDLLMRKILDDASRAISILYNNEEIDPHRIGIFGHSYGGNTVLFQAALDERVAVACSSGAACTYKNKLAAGTGIELAMAIPGFSARFDVADLVACAAPRRMLLVSSTEDKFSRDAEEIFLEAKKAYAEAGAEENLEHRRFEGGHPLTQERFDFIVSWFVKNLCPTA
jgi:dienelactone hydrolase